MGFGNRVTCTSVSTEPTPSQLTATIALPARWWSSRAARHASALRYGRSGGGSASFWSSRKTKNRSFATSLARRRTRSLWAVVSTRLNVEERNEGEDEGEGAEGV